MNILVFTIIATIGISSAQLNYEKGYAAAIIEYSNLGTIKFHEKVNVGPKVPDTIIPKVIVPAVVVPEIVIPKVVAPKIVEPAPKVPNPQEDFGYTPPISIKKKLTS